MTPFLYKPQKQLIDDNKPIKYFKYALENNIITILFANSYCKKTEQPISKAKITQDIDLKQVIQ